jgi:lysozyme
MPNAMHLSPMPAAKSGKARIAVIALSLSATAFAGWQASEGFTDKAVIPTKGDVPTIGHGSTIYEDGTRVKLGDTITRPRAAQLARNLLKKDEQRFAASLLPTTRLTQDEYDVYIDFIGQYGIGNWRASSMRRHLLADEPRKACNALLRYRFAAGYDCSTRINGKPNKRCWGVWTRQLERHKKCVGAL